MEDGNNMIKNLPIWNWLGQRRKSQGLKIVDTRRGLTFFGDNRSRENHCHRRWRERGTTSWTEQERCWIGEHTIGIGWEVLGCRLFPAALKRIEEITLVQLYERQMTMTTSNPSQHRRVP